MLMNEIETFYGVIETTADALRVFELCRQGQLGRVRRRLHDNERKLIRSGSVFVFDEKESGIKRWTDGKIWSPSRILGNFLIYRELSKKSSIEIGNIPAKEKPTQSSPFQVETLQNGNRSLSLQGAASDLTMEKTRKRSQGKRRKSMPFLEDNAKDNKNIGFVFQVDGLIKKTMSITIDGHINHLVCYYTKYDAITGKAENDIWNKLMAELRKTSIPTEIIEQQSSRKSYGLINTTDLRALAEQEMQLLDDIEAKWSPSTFESSGGRRRSFLAKRMTEERNPFASSGDISFVPVILSSGSEYPTFPYYNMLETSANGTNYSNSWNIQSSSNSFKKDDEGLGPSEGDNHDFHVEEEKKDDIKLKDSKTVWPESFDEFIDTKYAINDISST